MINFVGNLIQKVIPLGIITGVHFYDVHENYVKWDKVGLSIVAILTYIFVFKPKIKVQKAREFDESKNNIQTVSVQRTKYLRQGATILGFAAAFVFLGDTIKNIGITLGLSGSAYLLGSSVKLLALSKQPTKKI